MAQHPTAQVESERKYDVPTGAELPDWSAAPGIASVDGPAQHELDARYFDTADLRLLDAGFTLRRRTGGGDEGWHAKVPAENGDREELRLPLQDELPAELADLFRGITRNADVVEVARLRTTRTTWTLLDADGAPLAEVASDRVTATVPQLSGDRPDAATARSWHEVEIELAGGADRATADRLGALMTDAGFTVSSAKSKVSRALGVDRDQAKPTGKAGDVVMAYVRAQAEVLRKQDVAIRRDVPDAVHQTRVASRKLRATLKTFRRVLDRDRTDPLRADLQWYERSLSAARDAEVMAEELQGEVDALPVEQVLGPVAASLTAHFAREEAAASDTVVRTMASPRYFRMLDKLDALLREPPLRKRARGKAKKVLRKSVRKAWRRVAEAQRKASATEEGPELDAALHRVRKETRKARYAADTVRPAFGKRVRRWRKHLKAVQNALGEQHDAVVTRQQLRQLAIREYAHRRNTYTYGLLYGRQDERERSARRAFGKLWKKPPENTPRWLA